LSPVLKVLQQEEIGLAEPILGVARASSKSKACKSMKT
jgi:hypothetical protein